MRTRFFQLPGVSFVAIGLQTAQSRGIEIDNSSGAWLYIPSLETFVPPFTIGWSYDFPYAVSSVDIHAGIESPAGQVSTAQGDGVTVYLSDAGVGASQGDVDTVGLSKIGAAGSPSGGAAFISGFTPILGFSDTDRLVQAASGGTGGVTLVTAIAGKRFRLLSVIATLQFGVFNRESASNVFFRMSNASGKPPQRLLLTPREPVQHLDFPNGLDWPLGIGITYDAITNFADQVLTVTGTYQVI